MRHAVVVLGLLLAVPAAAQLPSGSIVVDSPLDGRKTITPDWAAINAVPLGERGNPVRAERPAGQRAYLSRLVCADGATPTFRRVGSFGLGVYGAILDRYDVSCADGVRAVFMDMYHPDHVERRPVPGFTIREP